MEAYGIIDDGSVRLRPARLPEDIDIALPWYCDSDVLYYSERTEDAYDRNTVEKMYRYFIEHGELYLIEIKEKDSWLPIGDAALCSDTMPIVIGCAEYRSRGIGKRVVRMLIERARALNWSILYIKRVYDDNVRARRLYEGAGFVPVETDLDKTGKHSLKYLLKLR
jgi:GNAT superfamily N-acetyltransferase